MYQPGRFRCWLSPSHFTGIAQTPATQVFGYKNFSQQAKWDHDFLAVPSAKLAGEELKILTAAPHWASSPEDHQTALYVAEKFRAAGLQTTIQPFRVWLNKPVSIEIEAYLYGKDGAIGKKLMSGPTPEHVDPKAYGGDPFQNDPRILPAFNSSSPSGNVTADVVYANYGTLDDFKKLASLGVSVKGKIVLVRYGENFRGVKVYIAQQYGAAGVLIYSDPADDGYVKGDMYPRGPYRPATGVQRGSVQFLPLYPGDPQTPGIASTPELPDSARITDPAKMNQPSIPSNPLSYYDAAPILEALDGPESPRDWQGGLPFTYHLGGTGAVKVHMHLVQDYKLRTIWDVVGTIDGSDSRPEGRLGGGGQSSRRLGVWRGRSQQWNRRDAGGRAWAGRPAEAGMEAEAAHRDLLVGRRRRRPDGIDGVGGDACQRAGACGRVLQYRRRSGGAGLRCVGGAVAEGVCARRDAPGAEPQGRHGL